jgi:nitrilase
MTHVLRAAVVQTGTDWSSTLATLDKVRAFTADAAGKGAKLVVFPEALVGGYPKGADFRLYVGGRTPEAREEFRTYLERAIAVPGPEVKAIGEGAREHGVFIVIGVVERDGGTLYCTVLFFGPDGALLGKHRKVMPTAAERSIWGYGDGSTLTTVETPWGIMGSVICWENYMPMLRMAMYAKNVALYCAPTADDRPTWSGTMQHIALEGRCFVLSACQYIRRAELSSNLNNRLAPETEVAMRGGSVIVSPLGVLLAGPEFDKDCILTADLDLADVPRGKFDFDVTGHYSRPDIFRLHVNEQPTPAVVRASKEPSDPTF